MSARRLGVLLAAGLVAVPAAGAAQTGNRLQVFFDPGSLLDSVYAAPAGGEALVRIMSTDYGSQSLGGYVLRLYYDSARVAFDSARSSCPDSVNHPLTSTPGTNSVRLSASGCATTAGFTQIVVATVYLKLTSTGAGSVVYLSPDTTLDVTGVVRTLDAEGDVADLCRGQGLWGDVDGDGQINSRDALIALSSAVGLPTPGFQLQYGDVDADGQVTSRDALAMLSNSIGLPTYGFRVGQLVVVACAPQEPLPRTLYASTSGTSYKGRPNDNGLTIRLASDTSALNIVGDSAEDPSYSFSQWRPRVSPDGSAIVFVCYYATTQGYPQICRANADGSGLTRLTTNDLVANFSPDWSPAGDSIVFIQASAGSTSFGSILTMDANGNGQLPIPSTPTLATSVAWRSRVPTDRRIAYTSLNPGSGFYEVHTRFVDPIPADTLTFNGALSTASTPRFVDWSPAGDSLVFDIQLDGDYAVVVQKSGPGAPLFKRAALAVHSSPGPREPLWTDQGVLFVAPRPNSLGLAQLYLRHADGRVARLTRAPREPHFPGMKKVP